uniref:Zgc:55943 n=1 Tax=Poecilia reticulata TaxID=8081 RepID=A0A3P9NKG3_POERE
MGCTSAKQVSSVPSDEEGQSKSHSNGDLVSDEHKMRGVEKDKLISGEEAGDVLCFVLQEKSALLGVGQHPNESGSNGKILSIHSSESQQEFFRMLDEKIEKGRDYCSEEEDVT